jgi:hypothetical protein
MLIWHWQAKIFVKPDHGQMKSGDEGTISMGFLMMGDEKILRLLRLFR